MFAVLTIEATPDHVRGYLSRFLSPVDTGVYVGVVTPRVVEEVWAAVTRTVTRGNATLITSSGDTEHGFEVRIHGSTRHVVHDYDGLPLPAVEPGQQDSGHPAVP